MSTFLDDALVSSQDSWSWVETCAAIIADIRPKGGPLIEPVIWTGSGADWDCLGIDNARVDGRVV